MSLAKICGGCSHFQVPGLDAHERGPFCDRTTRVGRNQCEAGKRFEWNGDTLYHLGVIYATSACGHFGPINDAEKQRRKYYREMMWTALELGPPFSPLASQASPPPEQPTAVPPKRGRGRPKGSKDKQPRKKRQ